jgi:group I intron endonuclease
MVGVYGILNLVTGELYVGASQNIEHRWLWHQDRLKKNNNDTPKLQTAWNKFGAKVFILQLIEECEVLQLVEKEKWWIKHLETIETGYNISAGPGFSAHHTKQSRAQMSVSQKRRYKRPEEIQIRKQRVAEQMSDPLMRAKIGKSVSKYFRDPVNRALQSKRAIQAYERDPTLKQRLSIINKERWKHPSEKMLAHLVRLNGK